MPELTSAALAAHDGAMNLAADGASSLGDDDGALNGLIEAEASAARREHVLALLREYDQLQALSPTDAIGWQKRRERASAMRVQQAWRRRSSRRAFMTVVAHSNLQRRAKAATTIQRAQRTRQRVVAEAAPSISRQDVARLQKEVVERTLAMAREMRTARDAREEWQSTGHDSAVEDPPPLPVWATTPEWARELQSNRAGGSSLMHELRDSALRGLTADDPQNELLRQLRDWPRLRAAMQAGAVRRQVGRTQAAALHAQLKHPPPLPPPPRIRASPTASDVTATLPPVLPSKASVLKAHQRSLRDARLVVEDEEGKPGFDYDAARRARSNGARARHGGAPFTPNTAHALGERMANLPGAGALSGAELLWLSSLEEHT